MMMELPMKTFKTGRQIVDWKSITSGSEYIIDSSVIVVEKNEQVIKVSKSGNSRKERRITVRLKEFSDVLEIGTLSFKKVSFLKRLIKVSIHKLYRNSVTDEMKEMDDFLQSFFEPKAEKSIDTSLISVPAIYDAEIFKSVTGEFFGDVWCYISRKLVECKTSKEVSKIVRQYVGVLHPDMTDDQRPGVQITYNDLMFFANKARESIVKREQLTKKLAAMSDEFLDNI